MTALCLALAVLVQAASEGSAAPEIDARMWFNLPDYRLHDKREAVLFFFQSRDERSAKLIPRLNRLHRKPDVVVIGLSEESPKTLEAYIAKHKIRFCVGAGSGSAKKYKVTKFPTLIRLRGERRADPVILEQSEFDAYIPDWGPDEEETVKRLEDVAELMTFVATAKDNRGRQTACVKLYHKLSPEEFEAYAEEVLAFEGNPYIRRAVEFLARRPTEAELAIETDLPTSSKYQNDYDKNPDAPEWAAARKFSEGMPLRERTLEQLTEEYWQHASDDANDVLIRYFVAKALNFRPHEERDMLRDALFDIIPREPDRGIRTYLVGALMVQTETGDEELAAFYEAQAERETSAFRLKPFMDYLAFAIRNCVDTLDPDDMLPPTKP